jgi:hypothetical protein
VNEVRGSEERIREITRDLMKKDQVTQGIVYFV